MEMNKKWTRWLILILSVSVFTNILLIGVFMGQFLRGMPFPPPPMSQDERRMLFTGHEFKRIDGKIRNEGKKVEEALLKEPYDKRAVLDALAKFDKQMEEMRDMLHQRIADEAAKLPPNERLKLLPGRRHQPGREGFAGRRQ